MRPQTIAVFFAGFAAGVVFLGVLLWRAPGLRTINASNAPQAPVRYTPPGRETPKTVPIPAKPAEENPSVPQPHLLIPVAGIQPQDLRDDFRETRNGHLHEALDIPAPRGTPVLAAAEGTVVKLFRSKAGGLTVYQFDDSRTWCYYYAHLDHYATGLVESTLLRQGDVLGYVGVSGDASPNTPHLHFAIFRLGPEKRWWEGTAVDPYPLLSGKTDGVP